MSDALIIQVDSSQVEKGKRSLADLASQGAKTESAIGGLGRAGKASSDSIASLATGARTAAIGIAGIAAGVLALGATLLRTQIGVEKMNNTLKFSTGSAAGAARELEYLKTTTNALGLEFETTATAYAKFSAAAKGTTLEGQKTRDIFESIAKASTVLGLSADETGGALKAIEQIISKGVVSSEELRGQLGERLPGAFQIAARAMGVTTQALGKMLEQGEVVSDVFLPKFAAELTKTLGDSPDSAAGSAQAQLNKLSNAWLDFKKAIAGTGVVTISLNVIEGTTNALKWFEHFVFGKGELADIQKRLNKQANLTLLQNRVDSRVVETSAFETDKTKQSRLRAFNTAQAKDKAELFRLKRELGLINEKQFNPATGDTSPSLLAPNFGVTKKAGEGGYDARLNEQISTGTKIKREATAATDALRKAEEERKRKLDEHFDILRAGAFAEYAYSEALKEVSNTIYASIEAEQGRLDNTQRQIDVLSIGEKAVSDKEQAEIRNTIAINANSIAALESTKHLADNIKWVEDSIIAIEDQNKAYEKLIVTKDKNIEKDLILQSFKLDKEQADNRIKEAERATKEIAEEAKRAGESIYNSISDSIVRSLEGGKSSFKTFLKTLANQAKAQIIRIGVDFFMQGSGLKGILESVAGVLTRATSGGGGSTFGGYANGGAESTAGGGGFLGSIKDALSSGNNSIVNSIGNLGQTLSAFGSTGTGFIKDMASKLGSFVQLNSSAIATLAPYAGAALQLLKGDFKGAVFTAIGTAIGGPIGGAIGSLVGGLFGKAKLPPRITSSRAGTFNGTDFNGVRGTLNASGKPIGGGLDGSLDSVNEAFARSLSTILKAFGKDSFIATRSTITKKVRTEAGFQASFAGGSVSQYEKFGKKVDFQTIFSKFSEDVLGKTLAEAIGKSELPQGIKKFFGSLVSKEQVLGAINTLISLKAELLDLPKIFDAVRTSMNTDQYNYTVEKLKAQLDATKSFVDLFYNEAEKFDIFKKQIGTQFSALNRAIPQTREAYRALVESIKVVDNATNEQFNGLIALAPALDQYYKLLQQQAGGISEVNAALAEGLNANLFSTYADYASGRANVATGNSPANFVASNTFTPNNNADLLLEIKTLREEQADTKAVLEAIAAYTYDSARTQKQWNNDGLPAARVI